MFFWKNTRTGFLIVVISLLVWVNPSHAQQSEDYTVTESNLYGGFKGYSVPPLYAGDSLIVYVDSRDQLQIYVIDPNGDRVATLRERDAETIVAPFTGEYEIQITWEAVTYREERVVEGCSDTVNCMETTHRTQQDNPASFTLSISITRGNSILNPGSIPQNPPAGNNNNPAPTTREQYRTLIQEGESLLRNDNYSLAQIKFEEAIVLDPSNADAYDGLAGIALALEDYETALLNTQIAVSLEPESTILNYQLAIIYIRLGDDEKALSTLNYLLTLLEASQYLITRGNIYLRMSDYEAALADYERANEKGYSFGSESSFTFGILLEIQGDYEQAAKYYQRAAILAPDNEEYAAEIDRIRSLLPSTTPTSVSFELGKTIELTTDTNTYTMIIPDDLNAVTVEAVSGWGGLFGHRPPLVILSFDEITLSENENDTDSFVIEDNSLINIPAQDGVIRVYIVVSNGEYSPIDLVNDMMYHETFFDMNGNRAIYGQGLPPSAPNFNSGHILMIELPNKDILMIDAALNTLSPALYEWILATMGASLQIQERTVTAAEAEMALAGLFTGDMAANAYLCPQEQMSEGQARALAASAVTITDLSCTRENEALSCNITVEHNGETASSLFTFGYEDGLMCNATYTDTTPSGLAVGQ